MTYTLDVSLALGSSKIGLTLNAQLVDSSLGVVGSAISSGFQEVGKGYYLWHYTEFPDNFRGGVKFYPQSDPTDILTFISINPEEVENADVKTSTLSSSDQININVGNSNVVVGDSNNQTIVSDTNIGITTNSMSIDPNIILNNKKEVNSSENIKITPGLQSLDPSIQITPGVRG